MRINNIHQRTIWRETASGTIKIIDQRLLPHRIACLELHDVDEVAVAIKDMAVRGAPLIGATAAYGVAIAMEKDSSNGNLERVCDRLIVARPTAVNLRWALDEMLAVLKPVAPGDRPALAFRHASRICDDDVGICAKIGEFGLSIIKQIASAKKPGEPVNILTHCNAGWLATIDWGTATAPIYKARDAGIPIHIWVDETRPRNQGAYLTAFELLHEEIDHTIIVDNSGGHLMQRGMVDLCLVGTDRTTRAGDVCNKIGTYLKALAAKDNGVPFYVALPSTTIDWTICDGIDDIPIERRPAAEITHIAGVAADGAVGKVRITPEQSPAANYAFDVTPARLVTGLITERGVSAASEQGLRSLFKR